MESTAALLVRAATAAQCQNNLAEYYRSISDLSGIHAQLEALKCPPDRQVNLGEIINATRNSDRPKTLCSSLEKPVQASALSTMDTSGISFGRWLKAGGSMAAAAIAASIFFGLLALVGLSVLLGRQSVARMPTEPRNGNVRRAPFRHWLRRPAAPRLEAPVGLLNVVPTGGGPACPIELWRLDGKGITVGRDPAVCDLVFADKRVSSRHARIWRDGRGIHIEDLGSTNGVWHDGKRVAKSLIDIGDAVRLGGTTFHLAPSQPVHAKTMVASVVGAPRHTP
jgi:hypothetical protein